MSARLRRGLVYVDRLSTVTLSESRAVQVPVEEALDRVLAHPLPELFRRRRLAIAPIREVRGQVGEWGTVGETRTIATTDGGHHARDTDVQRAPAQSAT